MEKGGERVPGGDKRQKNIGVERNTPETHSQKSLHMLSSSSDRSHKERMRWCRSDIVILTLEYKHSKPGVKHMVLMQQVHKLYP